MASQRDRAIYWRCFHCGEAFTKAQEKHARAHFGADESALPVCQMRLPGEYHLLNILRKQEDELHAFYAEDTELWRALHAQAADHAQALRREEERGYAKGVADARAEPPTISLDTLPFWPWLWADPFRDDLGTRKKMAERRLRANYETARAPIPEQYALVHRADLISQMHELWTLRARLEPKAPADVG